MTRACLASHERASFGPCRSPAAPVDHSWPGGSASTREGTTRCPDALPGAEATPFRTAGQPPASQITRKKIQLFRVLCARVGKLSVAGDSVFEEQLPARLDEGEHR